MFIIGDQDEWRLATALRGPDAPGTPEFACLKWFFTGSLRAVLRSNGSVSPDVFCGMVRETKYPPSNQHTLVESIILAADRLNNNHYLSHVTVAFSVLPKKVSWVSEGWCRSMAAAALVLCDDDSTSDERATAIRAALEHPSQPDWPEIVEWR